MLARRRLLQGDAAAERQPNPNPNPHPNPNPNPNPTANPNPNPNPNPHPNQATQLPSDAFGPSAPEGSEAFRFQTIAAKPSFIRDELDATGLPVAYLDTDLEFNQFPKLFVPGSWPGGGRDVAAFNYWGNETDWAHASTPTTGSALPRTLYP